MAPISPITALVPARPTLPSVLETARTGLSNALDDFASAAGHASKGDPFALIGLQVATYTAQASIRVVRAADTMLGALIDLRV